VCKREREREMSSHSGEKVVNSFKTRSLLQRAITFAFSVFQKKLEAWRGRSKTRIIKKASFHLP
jgi:hypothetical protein